MRITLDDGARTWLADEGYDEHMGARPLSRVIQDHIKRPLADEILFGQLEQGGRASFSLNEEKNGLTFEVSPLSEEETKEIEEAIEDHHEEEKELPN